MTKGIQYAIQEVQDTMLALGLRYAPDNPVDQIAQAEASAVCMAGTGTVDYADGLTTSRVTLRLWVTVAHKDTPRDDQKVIAYGDSVPIALWQTIDLSSTVDSITAIRIVGYGPWTVAGQARFGWAFEIDVLITAC